MLGVFVEPLPCDQLEAVGDTALRGRLFRFAVLTGAEVIRNQLPGIIASLPGLLERHLGVNTKRNSLLFAVQPILEAPPLAAVRRTSKYNPPPSSNFWGIWVGLTVRILVSVSATLGQRFVGCRVLPPYVVPFLPPDANRSLRRALDGVWVTTRFFI